MCVFVIVRETVGETNLQVQDKCLCECSCAATGEAARHGRKIKSKQT